jgi:paraquat-inducible protein B
MTDQPPPQPEIERGRKRAPRLSATWIIPILALVVSLGVAWNSYRSRGPLIEILFDSAAGIVAEETRLKFKEYDVGTVENVAFTEDLSQIIVEVRLDSDIAEYVDSDAEFWLVSAQVGPRGISGLDTVLSGAYIEGSWNAEQGERETRFTALKQPPLTPLNQPGTRIKMRAPNGGSIAVGAPLLYKQIPVGTIEAVDLTDAGDVMVTAFVEAPDDQRLTTRTRFWNASGFSIELGAAGAALRVDSLAALVQGGISFDTTVSGGQAVEDDHLYQLYSSESAARSNVAMAEDGAPPVEFSAVFEGSISGLENGADVRYRGIPVGEVTGLSPVVTEGEDGPVVDLRTTFTVLPNRLGVTAEGDAARQETLDILQTGIAHGLRAKLASLGLISSSLYIELTEVSDPEAASMNMAATPFPEFPTQPSEEADLLGSAQGVMDRVAALPIEEVMESVVTLLGNVNVLITDDEFRSAPGNIGGMIADLREGRAIENINAAIASFREVAEQVAATQIADRLDTLVAEADAVMANVSTASDELPALTESIRALSDKANTIPLEELVTSADNLLKTTNGLLASSGMEDLPPRLAGALRELENVLADLRSGGTVQNVNTTLASASDAAQAIAEAARGLPELSNRLNAIANEVDTVLESVGPSSSVNRDVIALLAEVRSAARAVESLASALERRPNSVLFGR